MSANSAVLSKDRRKLKIPKITPAGEAWLFVDVAQVKSHTLDQMVAVVEALGYAPESRIAEYFRDEQAKLEPVLLIQQTTLSPGDELAPTALLEDWEYLATLIQPATAVHLRSGSINI